MPTSSNLRIAVYVSVFVALMSFVFVAIKNAQPVVFGQTVPETPSHAYLPVVRSEPTPTPTNSPTPAPTPTFTPTPKPTYSFQDAQAMAEDSSRIPLDSPARDCHQEESTYDDIPIWYQCEYREWRGLNLYYILLMAGVSESEDGAQRAHEEQLQRLIDNDLEPEVFDTWLRVCYEVESSGLVGYGCLRSRFDSNMVRKALVITFDNTSLELLEATDF